MNTSNLRKGLLLVLLLTIFSLTLFAAPARPVHGQHAMVTAVQKDATEAGIEVMHAGGNAVDAAVAVGFALAVTHPEAGNLGGGGFLLVRFANGDVRFLDYREKAPAAATENMYLDEHGNVIPNMSLVGYKASGVPGSVAGMVYAEKKWGKLGLQRVMQPAIRLAREGFVLSYSDAQSFRDPDLAKFPESHRIFQRNGKYYQAGDVFKQPELANTLERIAKNPDVFYKGEMAKQIAAFMQKGGGLITAKDLADYNAVERAPIHGTYRGLDVYSAPPPSSGGVALVEILNMLEGYDLGKLGNRSAQSIELTAEAMKRAFYDRADFMGDPDFSTVPVNELIDKKYADMWRQTIDPDHATPAKELQRPRFGQLDRDAKMKPVAMIEPTQTTHYSVVDPEGNAVSVTTTLNDGMGSRVTVAGLGFLMNDEMDDFASKQGVPNMFGLIQGPANAIGPRKRPLSAMTPTIVTKDGKLYMVLGSPGGPTIITTVLNVLTGVVDYGLNIQEAVNAPRFHNQWLPDILRIEGVGFSPDTIKLLEEKGYTIKKGGYWGDAECIMVDPNTGERLGATDYRNDGKAEGY
ncbi:MAG: gamma-glutamyltransferase [Terriglobia bacterium]|nr:gamma-glutamyltransferase [Terriglobia bacterium]